MHSYLVSRKFQEFSKIDLDTLIKNTQKTMFKRNIYERVSKIGQFDYLGFEYTYNKNKKGNLTLFITLYFSAVSAPFKRKGKRKYERKRYLLGVKFPYIDGMKNFKKLQNVPIKLFSSDESFNYFFAYALNLKNAVILDDPKFKNHLKKSINTKPIKRNPNLILELTKHIYKVVDFLLKNSPLYYLDEDTFLLRTIPDIPNKLK